MKRYAPVLVLVLLLVAAAGFAAGGGEKTATAGPVKFSYLSPVYGPSTWTPDSEFAKTMFKYANVQIDIRGIPFLDYIQQFPTIVAGGALPDLFWHTGPTVPPAYDIITQGGALALDGLLDNYPNLKNAYPKEYWDLGRSPADGKIYAIPNGNVIVPYVPFGIRYRKDLFNKYKLGVPKTVDEFVQDMKTIMKNEPGITIGITADYYDPWAFQNLGPAFGYGFSNWIPAPGESLDNPKKIIPSNVSPQYKEFLRFMNGLRKDGIMDPDFMLVKGTGGDDKFKKGQAIAVMGGWWAYFDELRDLKTHNPDWELGMLPSLQGPAGYTAGTTLMPVLNFTSISSKAKDPKGILSYLDWYYSKAGYAFMRRGVWGKTFQIFDDGGKIKDKLQRFWDVDHGMPEDQRAPGYGLMDQKVWQFANKAQDVYIQLTGDYIKIYRLLKEQNPKNLSDATLREQAYDLMMQIQTFYQQAVQYALPDYRKNAFSPTMGKLDQKLSEQYLVPMRDKLLIDPNADVDKEFDTAVANWYANGGDKIVSEINDALKDKSRPKPLPFSIKYSDWTKQDFLNLSDADMNPKGLFKFVPVPAGDNPIPPYPEYYQF